MEYHKKVAERASEPDNGFGFLISLLLILMLIFVIGDTLADTVNLENGQNYHCHNLGYVDISQLNPPQVRFTCEGDLGFEITFDIPDDETLINEVRNHGGENGLGVVLVDNTLVQLYETDGILFKSLWTTKKDE
jgi:hypothetical protein